MTGALAVSYSSHLSLLWKCLRDNSITQPEWNILEALITDKTTDGIFGAKSLELCIELPRTECSDHLVAWIPSNWGSEHWTLVELLKQPHLTDQRKPCTPLLEGSWDSNMKLLIQCWVSMTLWVSHAMIEWLGSLTQQWTENILWPNATASTTHRPPKHVWLG